MRGRLHEAGDVPGDDGAEPVAGFLRVSQRGFGSEAIGRQPLGVEERLRQDRADALQFIAHELVTFGHVEGSGDPEQIANGVEREALWH